MKRMFKKGFTLIELLIVVALIAIIAAIALVNLNSSREKSNISKALGDLSQITRALSLYYADNNTYPCGDAVWDDVKEKSWSAKYLSWPTAPWGNKKYHWQDSSAGFTYSVDFEVANSQTAELDTAGDDGDEGKGSIKVTTGAETPGAKRVRYGKIDQSVPVLRKAYDGNTCKVCTNQTGTDTCSFSSIQLP